MKFEVSALACGYGSRRVLSDVSLSVNSGDILCVLGPNGAGKTTLFKTMLGLKPAQDGETFIDGRSIRDFSRREFARTVAYVPQRHSAPFPYDALDLVLMGRASRLSPFAAPGEKDRKVASTALERLGVAHLARKRCTEISGGEERLVLIARALAQEASILVMDEPTANLDFGNQAIVLDIVAKLAREGLAVIMTTHSPDHAFLCSSKVALVGKDGRVRRGSAAETITEKALAEAFGVSVKIIEGLSPTNQPLKACVPVISAAERIPA